MEPSRSHARPVALQKPVWAYSADAGTLRARVTVATDEDGTPLDARGFVVENFGLGKNLMLACAAKLVHGGAAECLAARALHHLLTHAKSRC